MSNGDTAKDNRDLEANTGLELAKLTLERQKIEIERSKAKWTAFSVIGPFVLGAITLIYGSYTQLQQATIQFQTKAIEVIGQPETVVEQANRAKMIAGLFPDRVPPTFEQSIAVPDISTYYRKEFIRLASQKASSATEVVRLWNKMNPQYVWINPDELDNKGTD